MTPWTVAHQAPLSMEFSRQEYWSGLSFPSPEDLPNSGIEPGSPHCRQILYHLSCQGMIYNVSSDDQPTSKYSLSICSYLQHCESESRSVVSNSLQPHGLYSPRNSPGQNTGVGSLSFLQGIFPIQESNWGLLQRRQILYLLSYQGRQNCL